MALFSRNFSFFLPLQPSHLVPTKQRSHQFLGERTGKGTWSTPDGVVQSLSHVWLSVAPWTAAHQASLSFTVSRSLLKLMSIESVIPSNRLILCRPLPSPPAFDLSQHQGLFQWVSASPQVAKVLELQPHHQSFQWIFRSRVNFT